jgi:toxin-antitoxin system PIN domain toxin
VHLLDVNALVAMAWDSHVHHAAVRSWFAEEATAGWATCPVTESGFIRVSSNPKVLPAAIRVADARSVLAVLRGAVGHEFWADDVSPTDPDVPAVAGYRLVTDAQLLTLARRHTARVLTFDSGLFELGGATDVRLLRP